MKDGMKVTEQAKVGVRMPLSDQMVWKCHTRIEKRHALSEAPYEVLEIDGNAAMYGGISVIWQAIKGETITPLDESGAHIGVGDGNTAASASQTNLQGTNKLRKGMDVGFPDHTDGTGSGAATIVFQATFDPTEANFDWREWGVFNHPSAGRMLNRKAEYIGTKNGGYWTLQVSLSIA